MVKKLWKVLLRNKKKIVACLLCAMIGILYHKEKPIKNLIAIFTLRHLMNTKKIFNLEENVKKECKDV